MKALSGLVGVLMAGAVAAATAPAGTDEEIRERLAPFGASCLVGDDQCGAPAPAAPAAAVAAAQPMTGTQVYDQFCFACHATGVGDAPLFQDTTQWAPRLAKGFDELLRTSLTGLGAMPPMGTCMACTEDEMLAAIRYLSGS